MDLLTQRLRLEALEPRHADLLFDGLQCERLYEFIADTPPASIDALRERYARLATRRSPDGNEHWLNWAIFCMPEQRYVGYVQATVTASGTATLAYVLFADSWGMGYASEAVARMIEHLIATYEISELRASATVGNERSIALLERLNFECVARREHAEWIRGVPTDEVEYRMRVASRYS